MRRVVGIGIVLLLTATPAGSSVLTDATGRAVEIRDTSRLVTLGGGVTEIVFALDRGGRVVGVDRTSIYPAAAATLPRVSTGHDLSIEGVLSLRPTLVLASADLHALDLLDAVRASGVPVLVASGDVSLQGGSDRIRLIGRALDANVRADSLVAARDADLAAAAQLSVGALRAPRVLFVYARGQRVVHVAGTATAADAAIRSAGAHNAITQFEGFRPLTAEGVVAAAPDVVLMLVHGAESLGGEDGVFALPGMMLTPAGRARRLILADDLALLCFGPRYGHAVLDIARALHANTDLSRRNP